MQDMEFTIEQGKLWMLQTRNGKRTARAALKIACDMIDQGLIDEKTALLRLEAKSLDQLLHPTLDPKAKKTQLTRGLPASPGGACGQLVFSSEDAVEQKEKGIKTVLARVETSPEDILGMVAAQGILTSRGGMTSHAAVVARGMGKCCVAGAGEVQIDYVHEEMRVAGYVLKKGDIVTLDGSTGDVYLGEVKTVEPQLDDVFRPRDENGRQVSHDGCSSQCRHAERCNHFACVWRRRHWAVPNRAYVLWCRSHRFGSRNDRRRKRKPSAKKPLRSCCRCSVEIS